MIRSFLRKKTCAKNNHLQEKYKITFFGKILLM